MFYQYYWETDQGELQMFNYKHLFEKYKSFTRAKVVNCEFSNDILDLSHQNICSRLLSTKF